jgi:hypothetical protein
VTYGYHGNFGVNMPKLRDRKKYRPCTVAWKKERYFSIKEKKNFALISHKQLKSVGIRMHF